MPANLYTFSRDGAILDPVDQFISLIWTERFIELGDFRLVFPYDLSILTKLNVGMWLRLDSSQEVMRIEQVDIKEPGTEAGTITFSGRTLTSFLENRMVRATSYYTNGLSMMYSWANPIKWVRDMVKMACTLVTYNPADPYVSNWEGPNSSGQYPWLIPNLELFTPEFTTGGEREIITQPGVLLDRIFDYARAYNMGFKLYYPYGSDHPVFENWYGDDTTEDGPFQKVLLSPDLQNIQNIRESRSLMNFKNMAHGWPQSGSSGMTDALHYIAYSQGANENTSGWDLYELMYVTPDDLALNSGRDINTINAVMPQRLLTELNRNPYSIVLDGDTIVPSGQTLRTWLFLGNWVTVQSRAGTKKDVRVTELITSVDAESGEKNYATLSG